MQWKDGKWKKDMGGWVDGFKQVKGMKWREGTGSLYIWDVGRRRRLGGKRYSRKEC